MFHIYICLLVYSTPLSLYLYLCTASEYGTCYRVLCKDDGNRVITNVYNIICDQQRENGAPE